MWAYKSFEDSKIRKYEGHAGKPMEATVPVTLTIDENGNIVG